MLTPYVLRYGRDEPLPEQIPVRAGPLEMVYEAGDLRYIKWGGREIVRRIYAAVRDRNWGTVPAVLSDVEMDIEPDQFRIAYQAEHRRGEIDFAWRGTITGEPSGRITFTMDGAARSTFLRNRIGFCVLHPMRECAGAPCVLEMADARREPATFPRYIAPEDPFVDMRAIAHEIVPGLWAEVRFSGDLFEMEDQRNWTDASFKTFCTPLRLPYPVEVPAGTRIAQTVTLSLAGNVADVRDEQAAEGLTLTLGRPGSIRLPDLGLGMASHEQPLGPRELERLRRLNLAHLRVDLRLSDLESARAALARAADEARSLGVALHAALFVSNAAADELRALAGVLDELRPPVRLWLIFHERESSTTERWVTLARELLAAYDSSVPVGAGSNAYFTELNRGRPPVEALDVVSYTINPQVHAFDNASLMETLEAQGATVESARRFIGDRRLAISPVTLKPRFNAVATGPELLPPPGELPAQVDERQMSLVAAAWTLGSIKYLAEGGAWSITYYETSGWRGVMERAGGSPLPEKFRSLPGSVFPLYHVLADVGEFVAAQVVPVSSSEPLLVAGFGVYTVGHLRLLVANLTPEPQTVTFPNLSPVVQVRQLDETNAYEAMVSPEEYRALPASHVAAPDGTLELQLLPYAVARIDMDA